MPRLQIREKKVAGTDIQDIDIRDIAVQDINVRDVHVSDVNSRDVHVPDVHVPDIDRRAEMALNNKDEFERLLSEFRPLLHARVSRLAGCSKDLRDDMTSVAYMAFYESVKKYDKRKGHFFRFLNTVVRLRLIDNLRQLYARRIETVSLEVETDGGGNLSPFTDKASIEGYNEDIRRSCFAIEIDSFKKELAEWNITMDDLVMCSPKHARLRELYKRVVNSIVNDAEIVQIIFTKHYFPIKKISTLTEIPHKKIERGRIFILASLIIHTGDYEHIKYYIS